MRASFRPAAFALAATLGVVWFSAPDAALAYIGPGAGITMLGALWGVIAAVALAVGAVLFWPIRAFLRSRRKPTEPATPLTADAQGTPVAQAAAERETERAG